MPFLRLSGMVPGGAREVIVMSQGRVGSGIWGLKGSLSLAFVLLCLVVEGGGDGDRDDSERSRVSVSGEACCVAWRRWRLSIVERGAAIVIFLAAAVNGESAGDAWDTARLNFDAMVVRCGGLMDLSNSSRSLVMWSLAKGRRRGGEKKGLIRAMTNAAAQRG